MKIIWRKEDNLCAQFLTSEKRAMLNTRGDSRGQQIFMVPTKISSWARLVGKQEKSNQGNSWNEATMNNVRDHTHQNTADHGICSASPSKVDPRKYRNCATRIRIITTVHTYLAPRWWNFTPSCAKNVFSKYPVVGHGLFVFVGV